MAVLTGAALLSACATGAQIPTTSLDPARCKSLKSELDAADARGTSALAAQMSDGTSLEPEQRTQVDAYHAALDAYVGGNCHTAGK
jgi:hypothetical protein